MERVSEKESRRIEHAQLQAYAEGGIETEHPELCEICSEEVKLMAQEILETRAAMARWLALLK
jgi:hypothetical protein